MKGIVLVWAVMMFISFGSSEDSNSVMDVSDYDKYLSIGAEADEQKAEREFGFWYTKYLAAPNQYTFLVKMAAAQNQLFKYNGDISHLANATAYLAEANELSYEESPSILRALAKNYISEHRFRKALSSLEKAENLEYQLQATYKMLYDVHMELGNDKMAYAYLERLDDKGSFDYTIRQAKWQDHIGDLDEAIFKMNLALKSAEESANENLILWTVTNLGDFYGHKGDIRLSYEHYLRALELDPANAYAKKGLAWIAFSHEKNVEEANRILDNINKYYDTPDYLLLRAEMAEYNGDELSKEGYLEQYFESMNLIGDQAHMYNKYNVMLYADSTETREEAKCIAMEEISLRPISQSYSLLAYAYLKDGEIDEATRIVYEQIIGHTSEPEPLLIAAMVLKEVDGDVKDSETYVNLKSDLIGSIYELGPTQEAVIQEL